jgi:hypothetical protein
MKLDDYEEEKVGMENGQIPNFCARATPGPEQQLKQRGERAFEAR